MSNQNDAQAATTLVISRPNSLIASQVPFKPVTARYTVTHAGNTNTSYSPLQSVRLIATAQLPGAGCGLPAPIFTQVNTCNTVELHGSPDGTYFQVKPYRRMQAGDVITLSFKGFYALNDGGPVADAAFSQSVTLHENAALKGCRFKVEHAVLLAMHLARTEARYEVSSANGRVMSQKVDAYVDTRTPAAGCTAFSYSKG